MELETRVYQKENGTNLIVLLTESLRDIKASLFLAKQLSVRDIKAQYRQSYLGMVWIFITPLTTAFVWVFLNMSGTINLTDTGIPYPVYAFTGVLFWSILNAGRSWSTKSESGLVFLVLNKAILASSKMFISVLMNLLVSSF